MALGFFEAVDPVEQAKNPNYVERRRKLLDQLWKDSTSTAPIQHWTQGAARLVNALANKYEEGQIAKGEKLGNEELTKNIMEALSGSPVSAPVNPSLMTGVAAAPAPASPSGAGASPDAASVFQRMIKQESGGRQFGPGGQTITSPAGALGIAQIMPGTAPEAAKLAGLPLDMNRLRTDAGYNKALGQAYYADQVKRFGDPIAAAAAYNAGPGAVNKAIARQDATGRPFSDFLPAETRNYMAVVNGGAGASPGPVSGLAQAPTNIPPRPDGSPVQMAQAAPAGPTAIPGMAPAAGGNSAALAALLTNPNMQARLAKNPLLAAILAKRIGQDPTEALLKRLQVQQLIQNLPMDQKRKELELRRLENEINSPKGQIVPEGGTLVGPGGKMLFQGKSKDDRTTDQKNYQAYVKGLAPGQKAVPFGQWLESIKRAGSAAPESAFAVQNAKNLAEVYKAIADEGSGAKTDLANIKTLREQFQKIPGGFLGAMQGAASRWGIKIGAGATAVEVADALINRLTPAQRQGMPGAASDRDVAMFRAALPSLMNTQEGRKSILDTMEAIAQYKSARAAIATQVQIGRMTQQQGILALEKVPDPFAMFKKLQGGAGPAGATASPGTPSAGKVRVWNPTTDKIEDQ